MFAGIGGFRSGLSHYGDFFVPVGYCEIDPYAKRAYEAIYEPKGEIYFEDARGIVPESLPDIDLICGGFPCQSFSIAGKRGGFEDARGTLFFEIARIARVKRPHFLLLENVPGLLSHDGCRTFAIILGTLDELGYFACFGINLYDNLVLFQSVVDSIRSPSAFPIEGTDHNIRFVDHISIAGKETSTVVVF